MKKWFVGISSVALVSFGGMASVHADHEEGTVNCSAFETGGEVWDFWTEHGYHADNDPEGLDGDSDGIPCESLTLPDYEAEFVDWQENERWEENGDPVEGEPETEPSEEPSETEETTEEPAESSEEEIVEEEEAEEGEALPATANTYPTLMLIGALAAGAGAVMFSRKKTAKA
jgi:LPXTG-motif cell wall-anchored protein